MNKQREESILFDDADPKENTGPTTLISAAKLHEAKIRAQTTPPELGLDPLYAPFIEAANELRQKVEAQSRNKIEEIKRETAEQTKSLYNKLTEAREEFKKLQDSYQNKYNEVEKLTNERALLKQQLASTEDTVKKQHQELQQHHNILQDAEQKHLEELDFVCSKNNALIDKLKSKIDQINQDYEQQLTNLQQKITYQKQQLSGEIAVLLTENTKISTELAELQNEQHLWQQGSSEFIEKIVQLESENLALQHTGKEKAEKLLRNEHALKLANEELERSQQYVKELEEKNNAIQKELFENWIHKKEEF